MGARILSTIGILRLRSIAARFRSAQNDTWRSSQQRIVILSEECKRGPQ
jgi:hypothetical protein